MTILFFSKAKSKFFIMFQKDDNFGLAMEQDAFFNYCVSLLRTLELNSI